MKRILATFGGSAWDKTLERTVTNAPRLGVDEVRVYDDRWLMETDFYETHKEWWTRPDTKYNLDNRGFGWFVWKPYVISHALSRCDPGDIVLYVDGDTYPISDLSPLYTECDRIGGVMLFNEMGCSHSRWCKRDCFIRMEMDEWRYRNVDHACARFMLFQNPVRYVPEYCIDKPKCVWHFLEEWQKFCLDPIANTFDVSVLAPEHPEFHEHRCEQAILTNCATRRGLKLYRTPCQAGALQPEDQNLYPQLFVQEDSTGERRDYSGSRFRNIDNA